MNGGRERFARVAAALPWLLCVAVGCGRIDYGPPTGPRWSVTCPWVAGFTFVESPLGEISDPDADELTPYLAPDGLALYFGSNRAGSTDVFVARRSDLDAPFGAPVILANLATPRNEYGIATSWDGTAAILNAFGAESPDLFLASSPDAPRSELALLTGLSTPDIEWDPYFTVDGAWVYFAAHYGDAFSDIYRAPRLEARRFGEPERVAGPSVPGSNEGNPTLLADGSVIVFNSSSTESIYFARRVDSATFGAWEIVPGIETASSESEPFVRPDGCELFFKRGGDLLRATYVPPAP